MDYEVVKCEYCKWARKAENKDYVGCATTLATDKLDYTNNEDLLNFMTVMKLQLVGLIFMLIQMVMTGLV